MSLFRMFLLIVSSPSVSLIDLGIFMSSTFSIATLMYWASLQVLPAYVANFPVVIVNSSECVDLPPSYTTPSSPMVVHTNRFIIKDYFLCTHHPSGYFFACKPCLSLDNDGEYLFRIFLTHNSVLCCDCII